MIQNNKIKQIKIKKEKKRKKEKRKNLHLFQNDFHKPTDFLSQSETIIVPNESITTP